MEKTELMPVSRRSKMREKSNFPPSTSKEQDQGTGRKAILILFFLTVALSFIFWLKANFSSFFGSFFGPSTWTFRR